MEVATTIRGAIILAKLSIVPVRSCSQDAAADGQYNDCYTSARGCTATLGNFAKATFDAISKTYSHLTPDLFTKSP
ncbi:hypothetical protein mRhiFer1_014655 [Rhinolophus ferrumequinum]|uniref:Small ribosomal subunit protein uS5 C-terminal domain-containing protein n=1 Tax=Rhinolophus ferrumequinum TaxID=59479 RepID=A0A7J7RR89_RHIFE|nr:hypothetical protein mRhiFer1_014655 [Rhinolophus ferrumequinum]